MGTGHIQVGQVEFIVEQIDFAAQNTNLWANTRDGGGNAYTLDGTWQTGTTFNDPSLAFVAAVKLTAADVGMAAPDPLCPSGPQM